MEDFKDTRNLKYNFSNDEKSEIAVALANKTQELRELEDQKKAVTSDYASKINVAKEEIGQAANKVASGYEYRQVDCKVEYHMPEQGLKTITRNDIDEGRDGMKKTWTEKMTSMDYNLWTQYQEENAEEVKKEIPEGEGEAPHPDERIEPQNEPEGEVAEVESEQKGDTF